MPLSESGHRSSCRTCWYHSLVFTSPGCATADPFEKGQTSGHNSNPLSSSFRGKFHADGLVSGIVTISSLCGMFNIFHINTFIFKTMLCPRSCSLYLQAHRLNLLKHHLHRSIPCRHSLTCFLLSPGFHYLLQPAASLLLRRIQSALAATLGMPRRSPDALRLLCLPSE